MDSKDKPGDRSERNDINIQRLKTKYAKELADDSCMKLIFEAATTQNQEARAKISHDLSQFLTKPGGLVKLFSSVIDFDASSQKNTTHNQRFTAIANIITCLPNLYMPYEDYCKLLMDQLKDILVSENMQYSVLASTIIKSMIYSPHSKKDLLEIIFKPIFEPFSESDSPNKLHESIIIIDRLIQNHLPKDIFIELLPKFFYSLLALQGSPSRLKIPLLRIVVSLLNHLDSGPACCEFEKILFHSTNDHLYERCTDSEELSIKVCHNFEETDYDHGKIVELVLSLLKSCHNDLLVLEFFFYFNETMWSTTYKDLNSQKLNVMLIDKFLENAVTEDEREIKKDELDLMGIIASNLNKSSELISRTLLNHLNFLTSVNKSEFDQYFKLVNSSMNSCLEISQVISTLSNLNSSNGLDFIPVMMSLRDLLTRNGIDEANDILKKINFTIDKSESHTESMIGNKNSLGKIENQYSNIIKDLNDKLEPVRVHALVRLKQLIQANEPYIIERIVQIYSLIEASLADPEPYVFLACIRLMVEMVLRKTEEIMPKLTELYLRRELNLQNRLNVGEVMVQLTKQMQQTTPYYAQQVLSIFFKGCQDVECLIRVSSLTNMGEICKYLGDSLGKYILDVIAVVEKVLQDDTIEVKCAAIDLLRTALSGLDRPRIEGVQREMKSMYQLLKRVKSWTLDEKLCLQLDLAMEEIGRLARSLILGDSGSGLVKSIKILSLE